MATFDNAFVRRLGRSDLGRRIRESRAATRVRRRITARMLARKLATAASPVTRSTPSPIASDAGPARFVIVCEHRTGSNLLVSEVGRRWPDILILGEVYGRQREDGEKAAQVTDRLFGKAPPDRIMGCKVMYGHVTWHELRQILRTDDMRAIHLRRDNLLHRYVSLRIADQRGYWILEAEHDAPDAAQRQIDIDVDRFLESCVLSLERSEQAQRVLGEVPTLDVWFEDLTTDVDGELRRVGTFLGAGEPTREGSTALQRQNPEPMRELVRNYDEVATALAGTAMARFLDPPEQDVSSSLRGGAR